MMREKSVRLRGGAVDAAPVSEELSRVSEGFGEERAAEVDVASCDIASHDTRSLATSYISSSSSVIRAVSLRSRAIIQSRCFRKTHSELPQCVADFEDFGTVDTLRVLCRRGTALRHIAGGEISGYLARVELVLQRYLYGVAGEGDGAEGCNFGVYACNAGDEEVGFCEVEEGGEC